MSLIGHEDVKTALVSALAPLGVDTAEWSYQGVDFVYPSLRVRSNSLTPRQHNGGCVPVICAFEVLAYSENPASSEANNLAESVANLLGYKRITISSNRSGPIRIIQVSGPISLARGWATSVIMECEVPQSI